MKLTAARGDLLAALTHATRIVQRRSTIPILSNVLLMAGTAGLAIRATDLDLQAETLCPAEIAVNGAATVAINTLFDFLKRLPDAAQVGLEVEAAGRLTLRAGRSRAGLPTLPVEDFPELRLGGEPHAFCLAGRDLHRMLEAVSFAISTEETRIYLNGIYLHEREGREGDRVLRAVSSDGHRLALLDLPSPAGAEGMPAVILPRKAQGEFARLAEAAGAELVDIGVHRTGIRAAVGRTILTTKLIDATFPDYERLIPRGNERHLTVQSDLLTGALARALVVISDRGRGVRLAIENELITVSVNADGGEVRDEIEAVLDGTPIEIGFNAKYAQDVIAALGSDTVRVDLGDPGSPTLWRRGLGEEMLCLLMPMRV